MTDSPAVSTKTKLTMHIGMGKTGTSSIQHALSQDPQKLAASGVQYLGMGLEVLGQEFAGPHGIDKLVAEDPAKLPALGDRLVATLEAQAAEGHVSHFVLSNERFFAHLDTFLPVLRAAAASLELKVLLYLRDPYDWLASAYSQWGLHHKAHSGPVQPFAERARVLFRWYDQVKDWDAALGDYLEVRRYQSDAIGDFSTATGVPLDQPANRVQTRREPAELVLRALYNDRVKEGALPNRFDSVMLAATKRPVKSIDEVVDACFDHSERDQIVEEKRELFGYFQQRFGLDLLSKNPAPPKELDRAAFDSRLIDYLTEITIGQAQRISRLERTVAKLVEADAGQGQQA